MKIFQKSNTEKTKFIFAHYHTENASGKKASHEMKVGGELEEAEKAKKNEKQNNVRNQISKDLNKLRENSEFTDFSKVKYEIQPGDNLSRIAYGFDRAATAKWKAKKGNEKKKIVHAEKDINIKRSTKVILPNGTETTLGEANLIHPGEMVSFVGKGNDTVIHVETAGEKEVLRKKVDSKQNSEKGKKQSSIKIDTTVP